ncbi:MAG: hypothetical protein V5A55_01710 [Halovenus sp.]
MTLSKKHIAGIAAVAVATAYSLTRWRGGSGDPGEQAPATDG